MFILPTIAFTININNEQLQLTLLSLNLRKSFSEFSLLLPIEFKDSLILLQFSWAEFLNRFAESLQASLSHKIYFFKKFIKLLAK